MNKYAKTDTLLKLTDVSLSFGDNLILRDINLEVKDIIRPEFCQGQIVSLLAPSGMGKTQLLRIIAGLNEPTTGEVLIGHPLLPAQVGNVGVVQQNYPLSEHLTVYDNLLVAAKNSPNPLPRNEMKSKIELYLSSFGMWDKKDSWPQQLSGGQKQRVAIAQQLLCSEHFLLLDEPFSGLDVQMIDIVSEMIVNIANIHETNTVIIVSHDITSTAAISDTLWLLGKDKDANGNHIPGAYIKHTYDMIESNLAWNKEIRNDNRFIEFTKQIRNDFKSLV